MLRLNSERCMQILIIPNFQLRQNLLLRLFRSIALEELCDMAHHRIRKFNTKDTYPEQNLDNDLCQAVVTRGGRTVWMRGQCPQNLDDAKNIDSHDPTEQTHKVMQNIRQLIEEAGGNMTHLVKVVVYITDVRHREAVYRTMGEYIKGVHPVSTGLVVQALARPDWLVEIDATAVIPDEE